MAEFVVEAMTDAQIEVRDVPTGHRFTYTVHVRDTDEVRILPGGALVRENTYADYTAAEVGMRVWNFAQRQMHEAGKIDAIL